MSKAFPTDKDHIIDHLDENYHLQLTDEECARLRRFTSADLFLITMLVTRAVRLAKSVDPF